MNRGTRIGNVVRALVVAGTAVAVTAGGAANAGDANATAAFARFASLAGTWNRYSTEWTFVKEGRDATVSGMDATRVVVAAAAAATSDTTCHTVELGEEDAMAHYLLLLYDDPSTLTGLSAEEMQRIVAEYSAWADRLQQQGRLLGANKLQDGSGKVLRRGSGGHTRVLDGPYSETKEVIGGYYLIEAGSYEEAVRIAKGSPHIKYGGTIEVREIDQVR